MAKRWFKNILRHEIVEKRGNISQVYIDIYISENIEFRGTFWVKFVGWQVDGFDYTVFICIYRQFEIGAYTTMTFPVLLTAQPKTNTNGRYYPI